MSKQDVGEFLFHFPPHELTREERVRLIKQAVESGEVMQQDRLDQVMSRLLEEIQNFG